LILPIGRLAIELFFGSAPLADFIGREFEIDGRWVVPLPHPSGASRWHQIPENCRRIERAINKVKARRRALGL
jgi:uracil-DNA glycosylase